MVAFFIYIEIYEVHTATYTRIQTLFRVTTCKRHRAQVRDTVTISLFFYRSLIQLDYKEIESQLTYDLKSVTLFLSYFTDWYEYTTVKCIWVTGNSINVIPRKERFRWVSFFFKVLVFYRKVMYKD